ncbi:MAG: alpha/beta hydrolase [Pseudomonadota bacterium]
MRSGKASYYDRGYKKNLVLIPGWGFDSRIFESLDIGYNYLIPSPADPGRFSENLAAIFEQNNISKASILGWSFGGFLAMDFLSQYGCMAENTFLLSMRQNFLKSEIDTQKKELKKNQNLFLKRFYQDCFIGHRDAFQWFEKTLLSPYIDFFKPGYLSECLDWLAGRSLNPEHLRTHRVTFIHGAHDRIAPYKDMADWVRKQNLREPVLIKKGGHMPFLTSEFKRELAHAS